MDDSLVFGNQSQNPRDGGQPPVQPVSQPEPVTIPEQGAQFSPQSSQPIVPQPEQPQPIPSPQVFQQEPVPQAAQPVVSQLERQPEPQPSLTQSPPQFSTEAPMQYAQGPIPPSLGAAEVFPPRPPSRFNKNLFLKIGIGIVGLIILVVAGIFLYQKFSAPKQVTLTWWGLWEDAPVMQGIISDFERLHPTITVQYVKQDPNQYRDRLVARIQNGTGPDIFRYHNSWLPMVSKTLLPLSSDVITPQAFKSAYYPVMQQDLVKNGAIYGVPLESDSLALFINTDVLSAASQQAPSNWDDFVKAAQSMTVRDDKGKIQVAGAALGTYGNVEHAPDILATLFAQQGIDFKRFADPTAVQGQTDVLNFYTSFATGTQPVWDKSLDNSLLAFSRGELAMYLGYSWDVFRVQQLNKQLHFGIYPIPQLYNKQTAIASYWVEGVSSGTKNPKEAFLFMQYLTQRSTAQRLYTDIAKTRSFGEPYARADLAQTLKDSGLVYPFIQQMPYATSSYFASDTHDGPAGLNSQANTYLENAVNGITDNSTSADSAVTTLDQGIAQVLQQYGIR